ncbi:ATP-binding protein [Aestuariibius insulae]|uniref:hybrid sensor histidine kinase/response regulator n=1 Tax=Aestuariibius insulae TaxID=2058287 RepID=UPI00345E8A51
MKETLMTMVESGSVMLLPVLIIALIHDRLERRPIILGALIGLIFAAIGAIVMDNAVEVIPGIRTDPRAAVIVLAFLTGGPISGIIATITLATIRYEQGGMGATPGIIYIVGTAVAMLAYRAWLDRTARQIGVRQVVQAAIIAAFLPTFLLMFVSAAPWKVFLISNGLAMPTNFIAVIMVGILLVRYRERDIAIAANVEKQAQMNAIADNSPTMIFQGVTDPSGAFRLTFVSHAACRLLGLTPHELTDQSRTFEEVLSDESGQLKDAFCKPEEAASIEFQFEHADGSRWLRLDASARKDVRQHLVWDGTIIDISAQRAAEEMKDNFISVISHELRTPLTSIRGSLGLALSVLEKPKALEAKKLKNMLQIANRNAERLARLVNEILDSQKLRSGQMDFTITQSEVSPIVRDAISEVEGFAPEKGIDLVYEDRTHGASIMVDSGRLRLVLQNLLSNAYKFSKPKSDIRVIANLHNQELLISVRDKGSGIPEEFQPHVFERFRQAQGAHNRNSAGTGLGLSIARSLVEGMGGRIWFETAEDVGTTFHVSFPAESKPSALKKSTRPSANLALPHLLYVEDDLSLQEIIAIRVGNYARVSAAATLADAIEIFEQEDIAAVLLDLDLPDGMALDFMNGVPQEVPIIVFSAFEIDPSDIHREVIVMTKSRVPEAEVAKAVLNALNVTPDCDAA